MSRELHDWGAREGLSLDIITVLLNKGFSSLADLRHLSPNDVTECFQKTDLLPLAKCLALRNAIGHLSGGGPLPYSPPESRYSPRGAPFQPSGPSPYGQQHGPYDPGFADPPRQTYQLQGEPYQRPGAPYQHQGAPYQHQGAPYQHQGASYQHKGAPYQHQGAPYQHQGAPYQHQETSYQAREPPYHPHEASYRPELQQESYTTPSTGRSGPNSHHVELDLSTVMGATSIGGRHSGESSEGVRLLLLGKTGSGKSTTGNTIFGEEPFQASANFASVTADCELKRSYRDGRIIEIMDSPGLFDTNKNHEQIGTVIIQSVAGMHPGPNAILYVVRVGRYTAEEYSAYNRLKALFDESITRYMIVLFTGGDDLERKGESMESLIRNSPDNLKTVLTECRYRYILFNNFARDPKHQVERLLDLVRQLDCQTGGPYVCPKYTKIGESLEAEVARRMEEVDKKELERQKYVQQLQKKTQDTQQALSKTKEEMERKEQEQKRQMEQLAQQQQQQMKALQQQMEEQKLSDKKRLQEERALRERQQEEQQKIVEKMEQQRREDQQRFQEIEEKRKKLEEEYKRHEQQVDKKELERQNYEQQLQKQTEDAQQALSKMKKEIEHKERENKRQMEQLAQQQQQQMQLLQQMKKHKLSDERQLQKEILLWERQQEEQQKMWERMEQQRREDQKRFQEMEEKRQRLEAERVQKEREMQEERGRRKEREMNKLKDEVVEKAGGFFATIFKGVVDTFLNMVKPVRSIFPL